MPWTNMSLVPSGWIAEGKRGKKKKKKWMQESRLKEKEEGVYGEKRRGKNKVRGTRERR